MLRSRLLFMIVFAVLMPSLGSGGITHSTRPSISERVSEFVIQLNSVPGKPDSIEIDPTDLQGTAIRLVFVQNGDFREDSELIQAANQDPLVREFVTFADPKWEILFVAQGRAEVDPESKEARVTRCLTYDLTKGDWRPGYAIEDGHRKVIGCNAGRL